MKTDKQQVATTGIISSSSVPTTTNSSTLTKTECLGSRMAPGGAVVCLYLKSFFF